MAQLKPEVTIIRKGNPSKGVRQGNRKSVLGLVHLGVAQAKALAPVDKGQLRNSIMGKANDDKAIGFNQEGGEKATLKLQETVSDGQGVVGSAAEYAVWQEFGTRKMAPQPFLRPALSILRGADAKEVIKKTNAEQMRGALKEGQKRETFR